MKLTAQKLRRAVTKLKGLEAKTKEQKNLVDALREDMSQEMKDEGTTSFNGTGISISARKSIVPTPVDWAKVYRFVKNNDAFDLFQRRLSVAAWRDRVDDRRRPIPGIESFEKTTLYITLKKD